MSHFGNGVEYALHCLLWLTNPTSGQSSSGQPSSRDLAELQGVSPSFVAKIFPKLEKAGIVRATEGLRGGYQLARAPDAISVLDVVDAVEGDKPLFDCQEIRGRCPIFGGKPPAWSIGGVCGIHAVMLRAEQSMREELARSTLATLAAGLANKMPAAFPLEVQGWLDARMAARSRTKTRSPRAVPKPSRSPKTP